MAEDIAKKRAGYGAIYALAITLRQSGFPIDEDAYKEKHKDLKSLLTDRPIEKKDLSVVVSDNKVTYSLERITNIVSKCYSIKEEYFKLKVLLNE